MEFTLTHILQVTQFLVFMASIVIAVRKINEKQNLQIQRLEDYNTRQDDRVSVLEKDNDNTHLYISKLNEEISLLRQNDLKHIETEMGGIKIEMARIVTVIKERLPQKGNGLK